MFFVTRIVCYQIRKKASQTSKIEYLRSSRKQNIKIQESHFGGRVENQQQVSPIPVEIPWPLSPNLFETPLSNCAPVYTC